MFGATPHERNCLVVVWLAVYLLSCENPSNLFLLVSSTSYKKATFLDRRVDIVPTNKKETCIFLNYSRCMQ